MITLATRVLQNIQLKISSIFTRLYFVFICIVCFSLALYVMFVIKLDEIRHSQKLHTSAHGPVQTYTFRLKQGTSYVANQLGYIAGQQAISDSAWQQIRRQEIEGPLDSLLKPVNEIHSSQAALVLTSLKLSIYHYNKLLDEAIFLHQQTNEAQTDNNDTDSVLFRSNAALQKKIRAEINPQLREIHSQLQELFDISIQSQTNSQQAIDSEVWQFKLSFLIILLMGGALTFLLIRRFKLDLLGNRQELKNYVSKLEASYEEIVQSRHRVREREARLKGVINNTNAGILAIDNEFNITVINNTVKEHFGSMGIHLEAGSNIETLLRSKVVDWKPFLEKALTDEALVQHSADPETGIYTDTSYNTIKDEEGQIMGAALLIQDVSEQKIRENQIRQLLEKADENAQKMTAQETILLDNLTTLQQSQEKLKLEEANLSAVINNTKDQIISFDTHYKIITLNTALKEYCAGLNISIDTGMDIRQLFNSAVESGWKPNLERAFNGERFVLENIPSFLKKDRILEIAFNPILDGKDSVTGVCLFIRDVTLRVLEEKEKETLFIAAQETAEELQAQQEELRQNLEELMSTQEELEKTQLTLRLKEARLRALINNTSDAIFSLDTHYTVTVLNQEMQKLYELRYGPLKEGDNFLKGLSSDKKKQWSALLNRALAGENFTFIWEDTLDDLILYHELSFNPVKTDMEDVIGVSVFIKDITQRNVQEMERQQMLQDAAEKEEELLAQQEVLRDNLQELMQVRDQLESKEAQLSSQINAINKSNNILEFDLEGNIIDANDNFLKLTQYTKEEIIGKSYQEFIPEDELQLPANRELWECLQEGQFYTGEFKRMTKHANFIWMKATYNPVLNSQGRPYKIIKFAYDITDRVTDGIEKKRLYERISKDAEELRMQEEELRQNLEELKVTQEALVQQKEYIQDKEARLRALLDNTEDDIYAIDTNYKIVVLNKAVQTRYANQGLSLELGYNIFSIIPETSTAYWKVNFDKAISGEKFSIVDQVATKDGDVYFDISLNPIRNDKNQVIGVSVLSRNINQYKMAEKENLQTIDILRKIQEKVASMNNDKEKEIESYKKKVEKLRKEMGNFKL
ncbi:PAS domain S-box protein [Rhodocytophaga rosea]|uniref:PAS domain S-box protein n=1 Tax=Rhodocytophaga rosea TaxID=2704465 RepID=A0A6C0GQP7_9BACT|nr:PAS domain S-box protein [Rhodocytophaga rosea]QHT70396.1 PAS domain S-box protein [Rhodocytophaga rosea]